MNTYTHIHRHRRILSRGSDGYERLRSSYASDEKKTSWTARIEIQSTSF